MVIRSEDWLRFAAEHQAFVEAQRAALASVLLKYEGSYRFADGRTTRHPGYAVSQRKRKLVEQAFGWMKTVGGLRKLRHRGGRLVTWIFTFAAAAYNIVRMRRLLEATA